MNAIIDKQVKKAKFYVKNNWVYWLIALFVVMAIGSLKAAEAQTLEQPMFNSSEVYWQGKHEGRPVSLMVGQSDKECHMFLILIWESADKQVKKFNDFGTCYSQRVLTKLKPNGEVEVKLDNKVVTVKLD